MEDLRTKMQHRMKNIHSGGYRDDCNLQEIHRIEKSGNMKLKYTYANEKKLCTSFILAQNYFQLIKHIQDLYFI